MTEYEADCRVGKTPLWVKTTRHARAWLKENAPNGAYLYGYNKDGVCILITLVRQKGNKAPVASARRGRLGEAVQFTYRELKS